MKEYLGEMISKALANSGGQHVHIAGAATGVLIASGQASVHANIRANDVSGVAAVVDEILRRRGELDLPPEQEAQLETAIAEPRFDILERVGARHRRVLQERFFLSSG